MQRVKYEIQQDNANNYRVIRIGEDGARRAWDCPPCRTITEARRAIAEQKRVDRGLPPFTNLR
jgi:hypothetical protein